MAQVVMEGITKKYNAGTTAEVIALNDVSFSIEKGEFVVILGASGAGKSTLLNILGGMDSSTSGDFFVDEENVSKMNQKQLGQYRRNKIGFVFQFYNLMPNLTALENIKLAQSVVKEGLDSREILSMVGLGERQNNFPAQLSGGEQQRVAIARAIVKNPSLLLCDEPTGALDSKTGVSILKLLKDISINNNKTIIIVTHNSNIAFLATRLIRVQDGRIIENKVNDHPKEVDEIQW